MEYVTDIYALNVPDGDLATTGDWHASSLDWSKPIMGHSELSSLGMWGVRRARVLPAPFSGRMVWVANHLRAIVDMLAAGRLTLARGMRRDYLGTDVYDEELFQAVTALKASPRWPEIDDLMTHEFGMKWVEYGQRRS